jgi:hypothetical protein
MGILCAMSKPSDRKQTAGRTLRPRSREALRLGQRARLWEETMKTFNEVWREIQARLSEGTEIPNWGLVDGYTGKVTRIEGKNYDEILVSGERTTERRRVPRTEFKKVFEVWYRYKQGLTSRDEIQGFSQNTTYIFSILKWLEASVASKM